MKAEFCRKAYRFFWEPLEKVEDRCKKFTLKVSDPEACRSDRVADL